MAVKKGKDPLPEILANVLLSVSKDRLQRAFQGIISGAYHVSVRQLDEKAYQGYVRNGSKSYYCQVKEDCTTCDCKDALYRRVACKHAAILCLWLTRPQVIKQPGRKKRSHLSLAWSRPDGFCESNSNSQNAG